MSQNLSPESKVLVVCLNPTFQRTMVLPHLWEGEVNRSAEHYLDASGKGMNVARVLAQSGRRATLLTHLGGPRKQEMLQMIAKSGVNVVWADSHSPIRTCTTIINQEHGTTTELVEEPYPVEDDTEEQILAVYDGVLPESQIVVFTGTRAPGYQAGLYPKMIAWAKELGKIVLLDIKGKDLVEALQYRPDIIKPNLSEFATTFMPGMVVKEQDDNEGIREQVTRQMKDLFQKYGTKTILTRGNHPAWCYDGDTLFDAPVEQVRAINTIGCGDAFTAGLIDAMMENKDLQQSVAKAVHYGALNAMNIRPGSIDLLP